MHILRHITMNRSGFTTPTSLTPMREKHLSSGLNALRLSPPPLGKSPLKVSAPLALESNSLLLRGLRKDVLELQQFIDTFHGRPILCAPQRELEEELLSLQHLPMDAQAMQMLRLLKIRSEQVGIILTGSDKKEALRKASGSTVDPVIGHLLDGCKSLYELEEEIAGAELTKAGLTRCQSEGEETTLLDEFLPPHQRLAKQRITQRATNLHEDRLLLKQDVTDAANGEMSHTPREETAVRAQDSADRIAPTFKPLSSASLGLLRSFGVDASDTDDIDMDAAIHKIAHVARQVKNSTTHFEQRLATMKDYSVIREQQHQIDVTALRERVAHLEDECNDLRRQLAASRFSSNTMKTMTTVHDAPMSYEVEKQYLKEHRRAQMRIIEVEQQYDALLAAGAADRQRCVDYAAEVESLKNEVKRLEHQCQTLDEGRKEQEMLFNGISHTRKEEAHMCSVAVQQLESRVAQLTVELDDSNRKNALLSGNFYDLFDNWCASQQKIEEAKFHQESLQKEYDLYVAAFNRTALDQLEDCQRQLLKVWETADENEANKTILRQQVDDANLAIRQLHDESKALFDRVRSSTEWKLLTVKAPEETKQLTARWQAMQAEREKREASTIKVQNDRIALYRQRADVEISNRALQHQNEVRLINAAHIIREFEHNRDAIPRLKNFTFGRDEDPRDSTGSIPKEIRQGYLAEVSKRPLTFEQYWAEMFPGEEL